MFAGLYKVVSGEIHINDQPVNNLKLKEHGTAGKFQSFVIHSNMNVSNSIRFLCDLWYKPRQSKGEIS